MKKPDNDKQRKGKSDFFIKLGNETVHQNFAGAARAGEVFTLSDDFAAPFGIRSLHLVHQI